MGNLIGDSDENSTWAVVRSPMWKGSGYRDETYPDNKNSWAYHNAIYMENLGEFSVAFPFKKNSVPGGTPWSESLCLGLKRVQVQAPDDEADPPVPAIYDFYLACGQGVFDSSSDFEEVINGYTYGPSLSSGQVGYDTPKAREQYRDAVVNVTFTPGPTMDPVTTDITITDDLFPDDLIWPFNNSQGIYIGQYTWPAPSGGLTWDQPYWVINSLTMP